MVSPSQQDFLFVFGAPRSGTTLVAILLRECFDYGMCSEGTFLVDFGRRAHRYGSLDDERNLDRLIADLLEVEMLDIFRREYSRDYGCPMDVCAADVRRHLRERSYPGVVHALFRSVAEQLGTTRVGNKFPDYWKHLDLLLEWFPRARFLHVLRDGRDVALSTMRMPWGERTAYACALRWRRALRAVAAFERRAPPGRLHTLRYESLLEQPERAVDELSGFLGQSLSTPAREGIREAFESNGMRRNHGKWRTAMSDRDLRLFEAVAGDALAAHGYERALSAPRAGIVEHAAYRAGDFAHRVRGKLAAALHPGGRTPSAGPDAGGGLSDIESRLRALPTPQREAAR